MLDMVKLSYLQGGFIAIRCLSVPYSTHMRFIMDYHMIIARCDSYAVAYTCILHTFQSQSWLIVVGQATCSRIAAWKCGGSGVRAEGCIKILDIPGSPRFGSTSFN
jgi:hypothetical protein